MVRRSRALVGLAIGVGAVVIALGGVILGWSIQHHEATGAWELPDTDDLVRVLRRGGGPSRVIFLDGRALAVTAGDDDAAQLRSSVIAHQRRSRVQVPGWQGGAARWREVVACVRDLYAPFDVEVTDRVPATDDYLRVVVGGRPGDIGASRTFTGLAPFNGGVIPRAIVFAFAAQVGHDPRAVCEVIGMETAHAYGLDHEHDCRDVMTYLPPCGPKVFVDVDARCGEATVRACEGGAATQNSYRRLRDVLGLRR
ncbi:MAG: hypothetical protein K8W52_43895 [Deltaproteobacteria bacterium]|nr:hypothetical protein [Deltaproteobacteria bacterium]